MLAELRLGFLLRKVLPQTFTRRQKTDHPTPCGNPKKCSVRVHINAEEAIPKGNVEKANRIESLKREEIAPTPGN
jgi:hypothetical protein